MACNGELPAVPPGFIPPDLPPKCTWARDKDPSESPHTYLPKKNPSVHNSILPNILEMIGNTPIVRLDKIAQSEGLQCELVAKCEYFNAGGSVKDRIGLRMVEDAERSGILKPGDTVIEPSSGNTGIGLSVVCAVKGYRCIIVMPEKMSSEKHYTMEALGSEVVRTRNDAPLKSTESHVGVAYKLKSEIPNSHVFDQYRNAGNPLAHYDWTAEEIIEQCGGKVDMVVMGAGTGGVLHGIGKKFKEKMPHVQIIAVDPVGSVMAEPEELNLEKAAFQVEGIGHNYIPTVLDRGTVDKWYKINDADTFQYAKKLIREEGLLCGGSSGSIVCAAVKAAKSLKAGQRCVVILPDSIRNYLTKFVDDRWLVEYDFLQQEAPPGAKWWWNQPVTNLLLQTPITINGKATVREAEGILSRKQIDQMPIVNDEGNVLGMVTLSNMTSKLVKGLAKPTDPVTKVVLRTFQKVDMKTTLGRVSQILDRDHYAIVMRNQKIIGGKPTIHGIVTTSDLLHYLCNNVKK